MTGVTQPLLLRVPEAAHLLGISRESIYMLLDQGELIAVKVGRSTRIPRRLLEAYVDRLIEEAAPTPPAPRLTVQDVVDSYATRRRTKAS